MANTRSAEFKNKMKKSNTTSQLEVESRRMEERLRMLKEMMSAEKARREVEGGFLWGAGQKGPLRRNKTDQSISTVQTTPISGGDKGGQRRSKDKIRVKILSDKNGSHSKLSTTIRCGQCDKSTASLSCVECVENYCQLCYAKFHQKGALASHHAKPVSSKQSRSHKTSPQKATTAVSTSKASLNTTSAVAATVPSRKQGHYTEPVNNNTSLLDGTYDEEESAASFQQALAEWRGLSGKTNTEVQAYTTKDSESTTVSSEGIQAGEAVVGRRLKISHPQIQFSGNSGVTYFEQLLMKRHRYDPMFLSKAKQNAHSDREEAVSGSVDDYRDLPIDEGTPSQYNIFYDPELAEPLSDTVDDSIGSMNIASDKNAQSALPATSPDIDIVELNDSVPVIAASPKKVTIKPNRPNEQEKLSSTKAPTKSVKVSGTARPKSVSKKQQQSLRSKSKIKSIPINPTVPNFQPTTRPASVASVVSESDLEASVKRAWTESGSRHTQLSQFFLHGVEPVKAENEEEAIIVERRTSREFTKSKLSSAVWLPGNSTSEALLHDDIDPTTDLPPRSGDKYLPQSQPNSYINDSQSESGDEDVRINEFELSVSNLEEGDDCERQLQERDEEDDKALDDLAWELASTVECEGRLTRCESELDDQAGSLSPPPLTPPPASGQAYEPLPLTELSQVMSDFELFMSQQTAMEQDSDY